MESPAWRRLAAPAKIGNILIVLAFVLVIAVVLLAAFRPDRGANLFEKAQQLEAAGQWEQALGHYHLLVETEPRSGFAPQALMQEATILDGMARRSGNRAQFQKAIDKYQQVAQSYPNNAIAGPSLLQGADLAANDLDDYVQAKMLYQQVLANYKRNPDYSSQAILALGRIALAQKDATSAQKYFREVLDNFVVYPDRCAEAQYQTGLVAETLTQQPEIAKNAYLKTIKDYPATVWATDAKARLGMLFYGDIAPGGPARRVLTRLEPLPDTGYSNDSPYLPLALVLSARGMEIGPATLSAWSLAPFFAGYDTAHPGRQLHLPHQFENAVADAGLSFSLENGGDAPKAFNALREAVDRGRTPVAYIGQWVLVAGYDTVSQKLILQEQGARTGGMPIKQFMSLWGKSIPRPEMASKLPYTFLTFRAASDHPKVSAQKTDSSNNGGLRLFVTPSFDLTLQPLSLKNAQRRTVRRAAALLMRTHFDEALLNMEGLNQMAADIAALGTPLNSPVPAPENPEPKNDGTTTASDANDGSDRLQRAQQVALWFGEPLHQWIEARRDAAAFLENAAKTLNDNNLQDAANQLRHSIMALQNASNDFPDELKTGTPNLWTASMGHQLLRTAQDLREAQTAEAQAAKLMQGVS